MSTFVTGTIEQCAGLCFHNNTADTHPFLCNQEFTYSCLFWQRCVNCFDSGSAKLNLSSIQLFFHFLMSVWESSAHQTAVAPISLFFLILRTGLIILTQIGWFQIMKEHMACSHNTTWCLWLVHSTVRILSSYTFELKEWMRGNTLKMRKRLWT